uniref:Uncharacterized protein n=1 Tax=Panagrolaimus sp. PS1159 TaxID=55785 RepID=A0AC35FBT6_9BILA
MLSSSFKILVAVFFIGYLSADDIEPSKCAYKTGTETEGCVQERTSTGMEFAHDIHEELLIWSPTNFSQQEIFFCLPPSESCKNEYALRKKYAHLRFDTIYPKKINVTGYNGNLIKYGVSVIEQRFSPWDVLPIDVTVFNFPAFWHYYSNQKNLKVALHAGYLQFPPTDDDGSNVVFTDPEDKCRSYRPKELKIDNFLNMDLYMNRKYGRYSYFFIKKDNFICAYVFEHKDVVSYEVVFQISWTIAGYHSAVQNYAPNFFCIDALYGTFVSLYWNRQSPPEAHFYAIDENNLNNIQLVDKIKLTNFHDGCLKAIFENDFGEFEQYTFPVFQSYGRQIFVSYKFEIPQTQPPGFKKYIWNGLWKNENEFNVTERELKWNSDSQKFSVDVNVLFWAKKSWIQKDKPAIPYMTTVPTTVPPPPNTEPTTKPRTLTPPPPELSTTLAPTTTPVPTSLSSTTPNEPKTTTNAPSQTPPLSSITDSSSSTTTTSKYNGATIYEKNSTDAKKYTSKVTPAALNQNKNPSDSSNGNCFFNENLWWILILIIGIDIVEIIIIILLIVFKFRGAKKLKEAMPKKKVQKLTKKKKKPPAKSKSQPKKKATKKQKKKKSTKEKSVTKTEDGGNR